MVVFGLDLSREGVSLVVWEEYAEAPRQWVPDAAWDGATVIDGECWETPARRELTAQPGAVARA